MPLVKKIFVRSVSLILFLVLLLAGCAIVQELGSVEIDGLIISNDTGVTIRDVTLRVEETGAVASCSYIPDGSSCSTSRRYFSQ